MSNGNGDGANNRRPGGYSNANGLTSSVRLIRRYYGLDEENDWPTPTGTKRLKCLRCSKAFTSSGKANRICKPCRIAIAEDAPEFGVTGAAMAVRNGKEPPKGLYERDDDRDEADDG